MLGGVNQQMENSICFVIFFLKASLIKVKLLKKRIKMGKKRHLQKRPKMIEDA